MEALADAKSAAGRNVRMRTNAEREGWESGGGEEGEGEGGRERCKDADVPMDNVDHLAGWLWASCNPCTGTLSSLHFKRTWTIPPLIDYPGNGSS